MQATATTVSTRGSIGRILALGAGALMAFVLGAALALAATGWFAAGDRSVPVFDSTIALQALACVSMARLLLRRPSSSTTHSTSTSCARTAPDSAARPPEAFGARQQGVRAASADRSPNPRRRRDDAVPACAVVRSVPRWATD